MALKEMSKYDGLRARFQNIYANLPLGIRKDIVYCDINHGYGPMTWMVIKMEVDADTEMAKEILKGLRDLDII